MILSHPLTNFEIQKNYQNYPKFNSVYLRNNLPKIMNGAHVINLDEYKAMHVAAENVTYFNSFGVKHTPKEIKQEYIDWNSEL